MKNIIFNQNEFLIKNNFSTVLKRAVNTMVFEYLEDIYPVPLYFEEFDKEISDLIIALQEKQETLKKKKRIIKYKNLIPENFNKKIKYFSANKFSIYNRKYIKNPSKNKKYIYKYKNVKKSTIRFRKSKKFIK